MLRKLFETNYECKQLCLTYFCFLSATNTWMKCSYEKRTLVDWGVPLICYLKHPQSAFYVSTQKSLSPWLLPSTCFQICVSISCDVTCTFKRLGHSSQGGHWHSAVAVVAACWAQHTSALLTLLVLSVEDVSFHILKSHLLRRVVITNVAGLETV